MSRAQLGPLRPTAWRLPGPRGLVSITGPDRDMATVSVDSGPVQTVDLYSATLKPATVVLQATNLGTAPGQHHQGGGAGTRERRWHRHTVDIDAYLALK